MSGYPTGYGWGRAVFARLVFILSVIPIANAHANDVDPAAVVTTYADIGRAVFGDAYIAARDLENKVDLLIANPTEETLLAARAAWRAARIPYSQSESFRFGNPAVDDWEGGVNSWPLDEGMIDYVDGGYGTESDANPLYTLNVIASPAIRIGARMVDASAITPDLLRNQLMGAGDVETNVATGYHAVEFLLWGQDLNGTGPGAGNRPATDFDPKACSNGNCDRRVAYLKAATSLLVNDLKTMADSFDEGGEARNRLLNSEPSVGLSSMLTGLGSLSYGELAGERIKLGLLLHDTEEEQDCFSDNTFNSHYFDVVGMRNVVNGRYTRLDGTVVEGPSLLALLEKKSPALAKDLQDAIDKTYSAADALKTRGDSIEAYDQMIAEGNAEGNKTVSDLVDALVAQVPVIERAVTTLGLESIAFEGSDSLDNPNAVFQ